MFLSRVCILTHRGLLLMRCPSIMVVNNQTFHRLVVTLLLLSRNSQFTSSLKNKKNLFSKLAYKIKTNKKSRNGRLPERPYGHPGWRP